MMVMLTALAAVTVSALTDTTRPTILSVSPMNNEQELSRNEEITIVFSEAMDPSTINENTFKVMQRTTPEFGVYRLLAIDGIVTYTGRTATFTSNEQFSPNQRYGNVFTVEINGAKDLAGNSLSGNYVWSFTTGSDLFNTDLTTSQLNQNLANGSANKSNESAIVPITAQGVQGTTAFPWVWVIGGAILLLLIAFIVVLSLAMRPTQQKTTKNTQTTYSTKTTRATPFGDVHPVLALEGIGPEYNKGLKAMGIKNTQQLWEADPIKVANKIGAPVSSVRSWQSMAELVSVKDIGPQYAELLERSGIHTIDQLKNYDTDRLLKLVRQKQDSLHVNIQGNSPGYATVENWIEQASDHTMSDSQGQIV